MAQAIYIYEGAVIDYTPAEDVSAGDGFNGAVAV